MISAVMDPQSGISQRNGQQWMSQEFVMDYFWWPQQTAASKVVMRLFGEDKVKAADLHEGDEVKVRYHIEAREYQGRWYNEVRCDGVTKKNGNNAGIPCDAADNRANQPDKSAEGTPEATSTPESEDDLPF